MTLDAEPGAGASTEPPDRGDGDSHGPAPLTPGDRVDTDAGVDSRSDPAPEQRRRGGGSAGLLGAAMLAVGEILEPEKTTVEIVQTDDEPLDDLPFSIDFGDLPPLE